MDWKHAGWFYQLSERQQKLVDHALNYAAHFNDAGVPGHNQFMLIATMAECLDVAEVDVMPPLFWEGEKE